MSKDLGLVIIAYIAAIGIGALVLFNLPYGILLNTFIADLVAMLVIFAFSRFYKNSSFYDAFWSVIPPAIALYWVFYHSAQDINMTRAYIVTGLIIWWAIRLTLNWASHWHGLTEEDWRYQPIRDQAGKHELFADFGATHFFPTLIVFAALLPVYAVTNLSSAPLGILDWIALIVTAGAILIETIADLQLHKFNATKKSGDYINTGLWKYSRHPNYFGELGFWVGLTLFGLAAWPKGWWWIVPGALAMALMFMLASIPMMDERSLASRTGYADHIKKTSALIPWFPK